MFKQAFNRFFPIPKFLLSSSFGLDISDESLKFAELKKEKDGIVVGRFGERKIPPGIIESGKIKDPEKLTEVLSALRKEENIRFVRVSLPEEQVYLFKLRLGKEGLVNLREAIELSLEEHIPISAQDAIFDYEVLSDTEKSLEVQVAAIPVNIIENYLLVFKNALISVQSFELEAQAIARAVIKRGDLNSYMIVDFGQTRTGIFIVSKGLATFTSTLDIGGIDLEKMIAKSLNVSEKEARRLKIEHGLKRGIGHEEIFSVILNIVSVLRDEVAKDFLYWHTHKDKEGRDHPPIKAIILTGGDVNLFGLSEYLSISIKAPVRLANVWENITNTAKNIPSITFSRSLTFAAVLGLALGDFEDE